MVKVEKRLKTLKEWGGRRDILSSDDGLRSVERVKGKEKVLVFRQLGGSEGKT